MVNYTTAVLTPTTSAQQAGVGPTAALNKDPYAVSQLRYPLSGIATTEVPSYVVFYINLPTASKYLSAGGANVANANIASVQNYDTLSAQGGTFQPANLNLKTGAEVQGAQAGALTALGSGGVQGLSNLVGTTLKGAAGSGVVRTLDLRPKLTRIAQSIAIYMPETVTTTYQNNWKTTSAQDAAGSAAKYAQIAGEDPKGVIGNALGVSGENIFSDSPSQYNSAQSAELAADTATQAGVVGEGFTDLTLRAQGRAINPHTEMLFQATDNRRYDFNFHFVPRSAEESVAIYNIIKTFKAFAAPEVSGDAGGRYFIPPGTFDIQFFFMGTENPAISKISTCALTTITVNYSGAGEWATFNDGAPLKIDLNLQFTETDIITRELITEYGY
jgi:hypothetical protein